MNRAAGIALALWLAFAVAAPAAPERSPISRERIADYDYSVEIGQDALNGLLAKFTALDARRTDVDRKLKELKVEIQGDGSLDLTGKASVPVAGDIRFRFSGQFSLAAQNQFEYKFDKFRLTKESSLSELPLSLIKGTVLSLFSILTRNKKLSEYVEITTSWTMAVPFLPSGWKSVYFTLSPKAMPALESMDTLFLGRDGNKIVLQGKLRAKP